MQHTAYSIRSIIIVCAACEHAARGSIRVWHSIIYVLYGWKRRVARRAARGVVRALAPKTSLRMSPGISTLDEDQIFCSGNQFGTRALPVEWGYFQPQKKGSTTLIPVGDLCASSVPD